MPRAFRRFGATIALSLLTIALVHVFLFQVPSYLVQTVDAPGPVVPLAAPDWATRVESLDRPAPSHTGGGATTSGIPAAPAH